MIISIIQRKLTDLEIAELVKETKLFPDLVYISPNRWNRFAKPYCLLVDNQFTGVCVVYRHNDWIKIGPFVMLQRYHGKGLGKMLLQHISQNNRNKSLFITSSNPAVQHTVKSLGFCRISSVFSIPKHLLLLLAFQALEYLNIHLISEGIREKIVFPQGDEGILHKNSLTQSTSSWLQFYTNSSDSLFMRCLISNKDMSKYCRMKKQKKHTTRI